MTTAYSKSSCSRAHRQFSTQRRAGQGCDSSFHTQSKNLPHAHIVNESSSVKHLLSSSRSHLKKVLRVLGLVVCNPDSFFESLSLVLKSAFIFVWRHPSQASVFVCVISSNHERYLAGKSFKLPDGRTVFLNFANYDLWYPDYESTHALVEFCFSRNFKTYLMAIKEIDDVATGLGDLGSGLDFGECYPNRRRNVEKNPYSPHHKKKYGSAKSEADALNANKA